MQHVPRQVVLSDLPVVSDTKHNKQIINYLLQILPLLMESLQARRAGGGGEDDVELQVSTLDSLCTLIEDTPAVVGPHVPALVPRLLELAQSSPRMVSSVFVLL